MAEEVKIIIDVEGGKGSQTVGSPEFQH